MLSRHHWTIALRGHLAGPTSAPSPTPDREPVVLDYQRLVWVATDARDRSPSAVRGLAFTIGAPVALALWVLVLLGVAS